jgi:hypothetical protein
MFVRMYCTVYQELSRFTFLAIESRSICFQKKKNRVIKIGTRSDIFKVVQNLRGGRVVEHPLGELACRYHVETSYIVLKLTFSIHNIS